MTRTEAPRASDREKPDCGRFALVFCAALLGLSGCGGGSNGSPGAGLDPEIQPDPALSAPEVTLTPMSIKRFRFTWEDVEGETEYRLLENPDGQSGFTEVASLAADSTSTDLYVSLPKRINASYILQACNESGCVDSDTAFVTGTLTGAVGYFKGSTADLTNFGRGLAVSDDGDTLAIGAFGEHADSPVHVFSRDDSGWSQQAIVTASNGDAFDLFGGSLSLSADGTTLAVGAHDEDSNATGIDGDETNNDASESGAVYVFSRADSAWSQQAYIKASNTQADDTFGRTVSLSADGATLAVGAIGEGSSATGIDGDQVNNEADSSGAVYVFHRDGLNWSQQAYIKASNTQLSDSFGWSAALSADGLTLAVGAFGEDSSATGIDGDQLNDDSGESGAVYVFSHFGAWSQQAYIKASNTEAGDQFGRAVALSGDGAVLAVGAIGESSNAAGLGGDQTNNDANDSGAAYVFGRDNSSWTQQAYIKASNPGSTDLFGWNLSVAADGTTLAVGAFRESSEATGIGGDQFNNAAVASGAVYLFSRSLSEWGQQAYLKAPNTNMADGFGSSVAMSADGSTLAVSALQEGSNATGIGGDQTNNELLSGAVYLY